MGKVEVGVVAAAEADLAGVGRVFRRAFEGGELYEACWGAVDPGEFEAWQARQFRTFLEEAQRAQGYELLVVRAGGGEVAAFALWQKVDPSAGEDSTNVDSTGQDEDEPEPKGTNTAVTSNFYAQCDALKGRIQGPHFFLHALATDPAYERQGYARALVEHGLRQADRLGWDAYLDASAQGQGVYTKWGFEVDGEEIVGLGGGFREVPMRRKGKRHSEEQGA